MNDLKKCPFCGSEAQLLIVPGRVAHWVVKCSKGCCNTCQYISDHDAEEAWNKRTTEEIVRCKNCKHSEPWYGDKRRCFLWNETGIDVFDDGYCNYGKRNEGR